MPKMKREFSIPITAAASETKRMNGNITRVRLTASSNFPGTLWKPKLVTSTISGAPTMASDRDEADDEDHRAQRQVGQLPGRRVALLVPDAGEEGGEGGRQRALGEEVAQQVGDLEGRVGRRPAPCRRRTWPGRRSRAPGPSGASPAPRCRRSPALRRWSCASRRQRLGGVAGADLGVGLGAGTRASGAGSLAGGSRVDSLEVTPGLSAGPRAWSRRPNGRRARRRPDARLPEFRPGFTTNHHK